MKILISFVGLITLWASTLNSGITTQVWIPPSSDKQATIMSPLQTTINGKTTVVQMVNPEELECMTKNIYFEAKNQPLMGQLAVALVVMNRVGDKRFPNTICEVVQQGPTLAWTENFPVKK